MRSSFGLMSVRPATLSGTINAAAIYLGNSQSIGSMSRINNFEKRQKLSVVEIENAFYNRYGSSLSSYLNSKGIH